MCVCVCGVQGRRVSTKKNKKKTTILQMPAVCIQLGSNTIYFKPSIRFHKLKAQSHKTTHKATLHFRQQHNASVSFLCTTLFFISWLYMEVSMTTSLGLISLLERLTEGTLPRLPVFLKGSIWYKSTGRGRDTQGEIANKGTSVPVECGPSIGHTEVFWFPQFSLNSLLLCFYEGFITQTW